MQAQQEFPEPEGFSYPFTDPDDTTRGYYGKDDRKKISEAGWTKNYARATAISIKKSRIKNNRVWAPTLRQELEARWNTKKFDANVKYLDEPLVGSCTGFLIAPDILVSAGHCIKSNKEAKEYIWYFGFIDTKDYNQYTGYLTLDPDNIFEVDDVMDAMWFSGYKTLSDGTKIDVDYDYSYMKLKRKSDRRPYRFRTGGEVEKYQRMYTIGAPTGLPLKLADNAYVVDITHDSWFKTNIDGFPGNSGGPVFNSGGYIEGIHVRGSRTYSKEKDDWFGDYIYDKSCGCVKTVRWSSATKESTDEEWILGSQEHRIGYLKKPEIMHEALYSNFEYAIQKKDKTRFDYWMVYKWFPNKAYVEKRGRLEFEAARENNLYALKKIMLASGKSSITDDKGRSLLFYAIDNNNTEMFKYLISKGISPNKKDNNGVYPLIHAITIGKVQMANELINKGAKLDVTGAGDYTPLHFAVFRDYYSMVETMVRKGASLTATSSVGKTPFKLAKSLKHKQIKKLLKKAKKGKL